MSIFQKLRARLRWPVINFDLSQARDRRRFFGYAALMTVLAVALLVGGIEGYEYTESREFCGTVCHSMDPQWVRYLRSPHANTRCADCHIGPGATFFVKSKIDGLRQVVAETFGTYHRPIMSPIFNLRPAREVCETCHTPTLFKDNIVKTIQHYDNDRDNTPIETTLILKMGGFQATTGESKGIHWHISSNIYYIAADPQRQVILWVGVEQADGSLKEYFSRDILGTAQAQLVEQARKDESMRLMDCIDCHNRTAHLIPSPQAEVDHAIRDGLISPELPFIRSKAIEVLDVLYPSAEEAHAAIDALGTAYKTAGNPLSVGASLYGDVDSSLAVIKEIYGATNFAEMHLDWHTNPDNSRHSPDLGCFRCHDGNHVLKSDVSQSISVECNLCHTVPITGRGTEILIEAPVIVGATPASHAPFSWTITHRSVTDAEKQQCYQCHGQGFCNNGACHNLSHPENMDFVHAAEAQRVGTQACFTCHQNITCTRCHPGGVPALP